MGPLGLSPPRKLHPQGAACLVPATSASGFGGVGGLRCAAAGRSPGGELQFPLHWLRRSPGKLQKDGKNIDWSKDGGDNFYSLTEDSEAVSSGYYLSEEDGSVSLENEILSVGVGPTVKLQQRHRKRIKSRAGSAGGADSPERCAATLKWDYSVIRFSQPEKELKDSKDVLTSNIGTGEICPSEQINNMASTDTKMLQLIHGTVRELQTETRAESRRA
ncbi:hypothetical protein NDU88_003897 [Pleurodeles waltl]|uniref:Uncharacterized protein n=1 Tax=Pleurodeles waltl TaxID=8319 RepID=A0AAV7UHE9_PLEWA|nr:hypothetical protein NDU88_003897 [Pleurodeles waltl]